MSFKPPRWRSRADPAATGGADPHADQPRDANGRYAATGAGTSASAPVRDRTLTPLHSSPHGLDLVLTKGQNPRYQLWQGDALVHERPATAAWRREKAEMIALAEGLPRDISNFVGLETASKNVVMNTLIRERAGRAVGAVPPAARVHGNEKLKLAAVIADNIMAENNAITPDEAIKIGRAWAERWADYGPVDVAERLRQERAVAYEREQEVDNFEREKTTYG